MKTISQADLSAILHALPRPVARDDCRDDRAEIERKECLIQWTGVTMKGSSRAPQPISVQCGNGDTWRHVTGALSWIDDDVVLEWNTNIRVDGEVYWIGFVEKGAPRPNVSWYPIGSIDGAADVTRSFRLPCRELGIDPDRSQISLLLATEAAQNAEF